MKWGIVVLRMITVFLLCLVFGYTERLITLSHSEFIILMPSLAVGILAVYYLGREASIPIFAAAFLLVFAGVPYYNFIGTARITTAFIVAAGSSVAAVSGGFYLRKTYTGNDKTLLTVSSFFSFLLFVVLVPSLINALFLTIPEIFTVAGPTYLLSFLVWCLAGAVSVLLFIPFIITWSTRGGFELTKTSIPELCILLVILIPYIFLVSSENFGNPLVNFMLGYFLAPLYIWLAIRFDSKITTLVVSGTLILLIILSMMRTNYEFSRILELPGLILQGFLTMLIPVTYLTHAFFRERTGLILFLSKSESNLSAIIENMPVAMAIIDIKQGGGYVNSKFANLTGYRIGDFSGPDEWFDKVFVDPEYRMKAKKRWEESTANLNESGTVEEEFRITAKDGRKKDVLFIMTLLEDKLLIGLSDITQQKQMTGRIVESERRLDTLVQNLQGMIFQSRNNIKRTMLFVSEGSFALTGYLPSEFTQERIDFSSLVEERFSEYIWSTIQTAVKRGDPYELQYCLRTRDGVLKWVSEKGKGYYTDEGVCSGIEGLIIDITERISILESLRISEQRYKSLFENMPISLWEDDYSDAVKYLEELPLPPTADLQNFLLQDKSRIKEMIRRIRIIDLNRASVQLYGETSREKLLKSSDKVFIEDDYDSLVDLFVRLRAGETYIENNAKEIRIGGQLKTLSISWYVMPGHETDLSRVLVTILDVTELSKARLEILELNQQLEEKVIRRTLELDRTNKELEAFSYSVSHDLKAPLRAIKGFSALLKAEIGEHLEEKPLRYLNHVTENADNMVRLINDLLRFSRLGRKSLQVTVVDTSVLVRSVWEELTGLETENGCTLKTGNLPVIRADGALIRQIFINLISNAVKFSSKKESPVIKVKGETQGNYWIFTVEDNGIGFEQKFEEKVFKVFQRLHTPDEFEGSGIGLALVQRIVHRHGGKVWAEGFPGRGAKFHFTLPVEIDSE